MSPAVHASSVEDITSSLARTHIDTNIPGTYAHVIDAIVATTAKFRNEAIPRDELKVTRDLAGPFTTGGLLILLWRPLDCHPWSKRTKIVVKECHTLDALQEAIRGLLKLSLVDDISVLDVEPLYNSKFELPTEQKEVIQGLLFQAIIAKQPQIILCMGDASIAKIVCVTLLTGYKKAVAFLKPRLDQLRSTLSVECFFSIHPSRSLHYQYEDCPTLRHVLFNNIRQACYALQGKTLNDSTTTQSNI
jgi:hypothetical protein